MRRIFVPCAMALTVFVVPHARAQSPATTRALAQQAPTQAPLSLAAALQLAMQGSSELASLRREIEATEGALVQAGVYQNPSLSIEVEGVRRDTQTTTVMLNQPFELGGKRAARMAAAERTVDAARAQLSVKESELQAKLRATFFDALMAQESAILSQASLDLARSGSQAASKRVTAGKVSPVEQTRAEVTEANVRIELIQAQGEQQMQLQALRALTNHSVDIAALDGSAMVLPALTEPQALEERIVNAPRLRQARVEAARPQALAELESAKRLPDITLSAGIQRARDQGRSQAVIGLSVPLPLFDTNRGNVSEALSRQYKAEDEARAAELLLRAEVAQARQRHRTASAEVDVFEADILPGAQSAYEATRQGFELGKFGYLEALDAQRTLLQARAQHLRSVASVYRAASDLDRLLGNASPAPVSIPVSIP